MEDEIQALGRRLADEARQRMRENLYVVGISVAAGVNGGEASDNWQSLIDDLEPREDDGDGEVVEMTAEDRRLAVMGLMGASATNRGPSGVTFERVKVTGDANG